MNNELSTTWIIALSVLAIWELTWKGIALWKTGRNNQLGWFVAILLINSAGILPIIYLILNREKSHEQAN